MKRRSKNSAVNNKLYIGIDNGVTGTIGALYDNEAWFFLVPTFTEQNYTKKKGNISRIDYKRLKFFFKEVIHETQPEAVFCLVERPLVNPGRFAATISAVRALEATLLIIEQLGIPYQYVDSREWQKKLLPNGSKGDQLKKDSVVMATRLFPQFKEQFMKHKDADGILMAEYCRRYY